MLIAKIYTWLRQPTAERSALRNSKLQLEVETLEGRMMLSNVADAPDIRVDPIGEPIEGLVTISGTSVDDNQVDRNRLSLYNEDTQQFWNGAQWTDQWAAIEPNGTEDWSYSVDLDAGNYRVVARTWDDSGNRDAMGRPFSVAEDQAPDVWINPIGNPFEGRIAFSGTAVDDVRVDRIRLSLRNQDTQQFWNGSEWTNQLALLEPDGIEDWSFTQDLEAGNYRLIARAFDSSNNRGIANRPFSIAEDLAPEVLIDTIGAPTEGTISFSGTSFDDVAVNRNRLSLQDLDTLQFWNGSQWTDQWAMFDPGGTEDWSYTVDLAGGNYRLVARAWDSAGNRDVTTSEFSVETAPPEVQINAIGDPTEGVITFLGTSVDNVAVNRNQLSLQNLDTLQFWNGSQWTDQWASFEPDGNEEWSYSLDLAAGNYRLVARAWDDFDTRDVTTSTFAVIDPDDFSNEVVAQLNEVLPNDWTVESRIRNNNIWFQTVDSNGRAQFDVRFGSAGVIAEIRDADTGRSLLAPSFKGEQTDRVIQWTLWETGSTVRHDVRSLPDFEDRFNTTQAGTFDNEFNGTVDVDLNTEEGQIDVWSVADHNWKSEQDPHMDGTVTSLTRTEVLDGGAILVRRVVRLGEINLNGRAVSLDRPYFEAWNPLSDSVFDSFALSFDGNGNPNHWFADGVNIPHYPNTPVANTRGWATSYDRDNISNGTNLSIVFGTDRGTLHQANGSERPNNSYNLNSMDFSGGMAILPGLYTGSLSEGAIIDQHMILLPGEGIDSTTAAQLDALAQRLPPPQVYQAGAQLEGELFAIADRLASLPDEPRIETDNIARVL